MIGAENFGPAVKSERHAEGKGESRQSRRPRRDGKAYFQSEQRGDPAEHGCGGGQTQPQRRAAGESDKFFLEIRSGSTRIHCHLDRLKKLASLAAKIGRGVGDIGFKAARDLLIDQIV